MPNGRRVQLRVEQRDNEREQTAELVELNAEVEADGAVLDHGDYECPTLAESTKGQPDSNIFRMVRCMAKVPYKSRLAPTEPHCGLTTLAET